MKLLRYLLFCYSILLCVHTVAETAQTQAIVIVSESWPDASNPDGSGLYWDIVRQAYQRSGYQLITEHMPYVRSIEAVRNQKADAWLGSYDQEVAGMIYSSNHFDIDNIIAVTHHSAPPVLSQTELSHRLVIWQRGFGYEQYLDIEVMSHEVNTKQQALDMLSSSSQPVLLLPVSLLTPLLKKHSLKESDLHISPLLELPLHIGFANTARGYKLRDAFDQGFSELQKSGEIDQLYRKYDWGNYQKNKKTR